MKRLKSDDETLDRLSELPESLILKILSFLEMRDVVRTTLVSKRWRDLWTITPCLDFDESEKNSVQTRNFINRVRLRWKGTKILKFKIKFGKIYDWSSSGDMDLWVGFATERKVEELYLYFPYGYRTPLESDPVYLPAQCLYSCSSITKLWLIGCNIVNGNAQWGQLKSLKIYGYCMSEDVISQVVSSAPQLEMLDVRLFGRRHNLSSLKKLALVKYVRTRRKHDPSNYTVLSIWAPNLEALAVSGVPFSTCLLILTNATLGLYDRFDVAVGETLKQILPNIQHVEAVTLSLCCFKMLGVMKGKYSFSVPFANVKMLKILKYPIAPYDIVGVVEIFPEVEKLVIVEDC